MRASIKRVLKLLSVALILNFVGVGACYGFDVYQQGIQREVRIESNIPQIGAPGEPIAALTSAISQDRFAARFVVRWNDGALGTHFEGWMLYDRRKSTLEFDDVVNGEANSSHIAYSFTDVNDETLAQLAGTSSSLFELPKRLSKSGCHVRKIADTTKTS